jgi:hypothetical protein
MHPPFGFALFYLRSVAPAKDYADRVSRRMIKGVTTGQIYWGAVPFVLIQVVMVGLVIAFPQMVLVYKAGEAKYDINKIQIIVPEATPLTPGGKGGAQQQEDAEKALERAFGGGNDAPAAKEPAPGGTHPPAAGEGAPPPASEPAPSSEQEDAMKALEKAMQGTPPASGK